MLNCFECGCFARESENDELFNLTHLLWVRASPAFLKLLLDDAIARRDAWIESKSPRLFSVDVRAVVVLPLQSSGRRASRVTFAPS